MESATGPGGILVKFETQTNRVEGLSFHPKRTWILASLHTGVIQLWDYRVGSLIDRFEEHDGPVRGIDFHVNQPLFVSGGDDALVKVWNYKLKRCLFTLTGHMDYIRSVQFHTKYPWIVSAGDDQTLRIWNWQSRSCRSVLAGHNHYVMSACFHPKKDLVLSASMDKTIRLWDLYGLKPQSGTGQLGQVAQDIFGSSDVHVKAILEGHERGVNYASFHPTLPLIVSGSDDRTIRIWRMEDMKTYEINQPLRGHVNNVSRVMYFKDYVVSNSEDKSIRVWDTKTSMFVLASRKENKRFWALAVQPERNLIAAGHDGGMIVFKLERERPAMQLLEDTLYWVRSGNAGERQLRSYDFATKTEVTELTLSRRQTCPPHVLSICAEEKMVGFSYADDGGTVELYAFGKNAATSTEELRTGAFFARNKYAGLDSHRNIVVKNTAGNKLATLPPVHDADTLFWAPAGDVLLRSEDNLYLFDMQKKRVVAQAAASRVKSVVWSRDGSRLAALCKSSVLVFTRKGLKATSTTHENMRVKSACFDDAPGSNSTLIYCTMNHLKYCLPNGDIGTLKTLDAPLYLVRATGEEISFIGRDGMFGTMKVDISEYQLKLALMGEKWGDLLKIVKKQKLRGQSLVTYFQSKGYPEIAMQFVKDPKLRFKLAITCGDLNEAQTSANDLNDPALWSQLADTALSYGRMELASRSLCKLDGAAGYQKLAFMNVLLGADEKARDFADMQRGDLGFRFQTALLTGDHESRVKLLEEAGQYTLAHQVAIRHGMTDKAASLLKATATSIVGAMSKPLTEDEEEEDDEREDVIATRNRMAMRAREKAFEVTNRMAGMSGTPLPMLKKTPITTDWPMTRISESQVMVALKKGVNAEHAQPDEPIEAGGAWDVGGLDDDLEEPKQDGGWGEEGAVDDLDMDGDDMGGGWAMQDDLIGLDAEDLMVGKGDKDIQMPNPGRPTTRLWVDGSRHACDHTAAGNFESAMRLLKTHYGILDFAPLKPYFMQCYAAANGSMPVSTALPPHVAYQSTPDRLPIRSLFLSTLQDKAKQGGTFTTHGKFAEAKTAFQQLLKMAVLFVAPESKILEKNDLIKKARNYASALSLQLARAEFESKPAKSAEMAAYFTHYDLDPGHMGLVLKFAMHETWKRQYIRASIAIARRLLDYNPEAKVAAQARKVMSTDDSNSTKQINYDPRNPFEVCVKSWDGMIVGTVTPIRCGYCGATAKPQYSGDLCPICEVGELGRDVPGQPKELG
ncbi:Coatomer subunit alpha-3 [Diplonema papillatum]|nr:Coatomer subunit alpha-3 [Diplonema papillatum]